MIISKYVTVIIFVEFIDQLIDYPINRASRKRNMAKLLSTVKPVLVVTSIK